MNQSPHERTLRTQALKARGGRRGWCPDCADEGDDPQHRNNSILCSKHYARRNRRYQPVETPATQFRNELQERGGRKGWCPECADEGVDPNHGRDWILCTRHYMRHYRTRLSGMQYTSRNLQTRRQKRLEQARQQHQEHLASLPEEERGEVWGWCPVCDKENLMPKHQRHSVYCAKHDPAQTPKRKRKRVRASGALSPLKVAYDRSDKEKEE